MDVQPTLQPEVERAFVVTLTHAERQALLTEGTKLDYNMPTVRALVSQLTNQEKWR